MENPTGIYRWERDRRVTVMRSPHADWRRLGKMDNIKCTDAECASILQRLSKILESRGFSINCNGKARGASGSYWDIPCVGSVRIGPLVFSIGIVAVELVNSQVIEYFFSAKNDLALDKVIIVARRRPPEDIEKLAARLGIQVVVYEKVKQAAMEAERAAAQSRALYVWPAISREEVLERIKAGRIRGIKPVIPILGKRKDILGIRLLLFPLLCFKGTAHAHLGEKGVIATRDVDLCFEGGSGSLVTMEDKGLSIVWEWAQLGEIEDSAVDVLTMISKIGTVGLPQLKEHFGDMDVEVALNVLEDYGLIDRLGGDMYTIAKPPIDDYKSPMIELRDRIREEPPSGACTKKLEPQVDSMKLRRIVEAVGTVEEEALLYYPIYMIVVKEEKSPVKLTILVDGITGSRMDDLEEVISDSIMLKAIDKIVEEIEEAGDCESEPAQPPHGQ